MISTNIINSTPNLTNLEQDCPLSELEKLPKEIIGHILQQLIEITGNKGNLYKADIPVTMKYAKNLFCTSKKMLSYSKDSIVTSLFLDSLSKKYDETLEYLAVKFDTIGARQWLWEYIKKNGDYEAYQVIQEIRKMAFEILKESKELGIEFNAFEVEKNLYSNPNHHQTKRGFVLYNRYWPERMTTPFGEIMLFNIGNYSGMAAPSISEIFIKRLNATFERVYCHDYERIYEIISPQESDKIRKISKEEMRQIDKRNLESKYGTQNLIYSSCSIYKIRQVGDKVLPDVTLYDSEEHQRNYLVINKIWKMLKTDHLGNDPIAKKIKEKKVIEPSLSLFKNISEIIPWAIESLKQLVQGSPFFNTLGSSDTSTVLIVENDHAAITIELLNKAAQEISKENIEWNVRCVRSVSCYDIDKDQKDTERRLGLTLDKLDNYKPFDLDTLVKTYDSVLKKVGCNWVKSKLGDNPNIFYTRSEEEHILFIKKEEFIPQEDDFLNALANLLGLSKFMVADSDWKNATNNGPMPRYLWIRKDMLELVRDCLQLNLD